MSTLDWIVMITLLFVIIIYGVIKSKGQNGADTFIRAGRDMPWHTVLLGIMATQASAITFISGPGQAYNDGMRFLQYYFGLPLAMIVISAVFVPIFQKLNVYTAYEYLDKRFDKKTRVFTGVLFLFSRGISTGMSVYAPAIVLSALLGWNIYASCIIVGGALIIYSYTGGAKAIAHTQKIQFIIILSAMIVAAVVIVLKLPKGVNVTDALYIAGKSGKLNVITTQFDWKDKYNIFSGIIGGFFLALSYFGTDQSQVGRYLTGKGIRESRLGLLMNGIVKIPMQFFILLIGAMLFSFFIIVKPPIFFNEKATNEIAQVAPEAYQALQIQHNITVQQQKNIALNLTGLRNSHLNNKDVLIKKNIEKLTQTQLTLSKQKAELENLITANNLPVEKRDVNYVFLYFVKHYLPIGMVGLLFTIVFLASWSSISAALNSLASATLIDFHIAFTKNKLSAKQELFYGRVYTLLWGVFSILVAMFATRMGSLIEAVNELGSLFYGSILGIFLTAFFLKFIKGKSVFFAAIVSEVIVLMVYKMDIVGFLWLNVIGALSVMMVSIILQRFFITTKSG